MSNELALVTELMEYSPDTLIELFVLDLSPIAEYYESVGSPIVTQQYYFYNGVNIRGDGGATNIVWQGNTYAKLPIEMDFYSISSGGELPRPTIRIADNSNPRLILPLLLAYDDLIGASIIRKRTFLKFLDATNFNGGISPYTPDPSAHFPDEIFRIDRKSSETKGAVELELAVPWDVEGVLLPRRLVLPNLCPWTYRGALSSSGTMHRSTNAADANIADTYSRSTIAGPTGAPVGRLYSIASTGTTVVAVGTRGLVVRSTNSGTSWTKISAGITETLYSVIYALGAFIAVGTNGKIYTSTDGTGTWTARTSGITDTLYSVASNGTYVVAVGRAKKVIYSTTLSSWTAATIPALNTNSSLDAVIEFKTCVYNSTNSKFIIAGSGGHMAYCTTPNSTWTAITVRTTTTINSMAVNGARTVAVGRGGVCLTTDDAITWTNRGSVARVELTGVVYTTGNIFIACGIDGSIHKSLDDLEAATNGTGWVETYRKKSDSFRGLHYISSGTVLLVAGGDELIASSSSSGCTYDGHKYFTADDVPTTVDNDRCGKRYSSCVLRFGNQSINLPFGGFKAVGIISR